MVVAVAVLSTTHYILHGNGNFVVVESVRLGCEPALVNLTLLLCSGDLQGFALSPVYSSSFLLYLLCKHMSLFARVFLHI